MRGRRPIPHEMKVLDGTAKTSTGKAAGPAPEGYAIEPLTCPRWLTPEAKKEWRRLAPAMKRIKVLTIADRAAFISYCENYGRAERVSRKLRELTEVAGESALLVKTPNGAVQQNPLLAILNRAEEKMMKAAGELGLTPSSRARLAIQVMSGEEEEDSRKRGILDP